MKCPLCKEANGTPHEAICAKCDEAISGPMKRPWAAIVNLRSRDLKFRVNFSHPEREVFVIDHPWWWFNLKMWDNGLPAELGIMCGIILNRECARAYYLDTTQPRRRMVGYGSAIPYLRRFKGGGPSRTSSISPAGSETAHMMAAMGPAYAWDDGLRTCLRCKKMVVQCCYCGLAGKKT